MTDLPKSFAEPPADAIASYDYADIAEGTGVVTFLGYSAEIAGTQNYHLGKATIYSDLVETVGTTGVGSLAHLDIDFDTSVFKLPQTIEGTALVSFSCGLDGAAGSKSGNWYATAILIHVDADDNETILATASGAIKCTVETALISLPVTKQDFKKGEKIRLTMQFWLTCTVGGIKVTIAHDPKDRDGTQIIPSADASSTTKLELHVPFNLDL